MRNDNDNIEIRKLTLHVNDRPINVLAPVKVPKAKYSAVKAIQYQTEMLNKNNGQNKKEREEAKASEERQRQIDLGQFYEGVKLR